MKFYNSIGPNPQVVRIFMAEKGISLPRVEIDVVTGENRREPYLAKNSAGQCPALELDDGYCLTETTAICEYLEDVQPKPVLIGDSPRAKADCRRWVRRIDLTICEPMLAGFRYCEGLPLFKDRMVTVPEAAAGLKRIAQDRLRWLDLEMSGKAFVCGDRFTLADIVLYSFIAFGNQVGQPLNPDLKNIAGWFARVNERPTANA